MIDAVSWRKRCGWFHLFGNRLSYTKTYPHESLEGYCVPGQLRVKLVYGDIHDEALMAYLRKLVNDSS